MNFASLFWRWLLPGLVIVACAMFIPPILTPIVGGWLGQFTAFAMALLAVLIGMWINRKFVKHD